MQASTTSSLHTSHFFVMTAALSVLKIIARAFRGDCQVSHDFTSSFCPLL